MIEVHSKATQEDISVNRIIGHVKGTKDGPTIIFTGGIHGNEPSGVFALKSVIDKLNSLQISMKGNLYAIAGNMWALQRGERYHSMDLNRLWTAPRMKKILNGKQSELGVNPDTAEQLEIFEVIQGIIENESGPFFFLDLHTTSSQTMPFLTVNDTILNRKFSQQFPVPSILGIEEFLEGPLLSYINYLGYIAVGFESGQHDDIQSITNHEAFAMIAAVTAGCINKDELPDYDEYLNTLRKASKGTGDIYEITHRHEIAPEEEFVMHPGYVNFSNIKKGVHLAESNDRPVLSPRSGKIFMPLYQKQGNDGYFIVRRIPPFVLKLSAGLRKIKFDRILTILPGVKWANPKKKTLIIKLNVAKFFAKDFFHLLGYRSKQVDSEYMYAKNRETSMRSEAYDKIRKDWK